MVKKDDEVRLREAYLQVAKKDATFKVFEEGKAPDKYSGNSAIGKITQKTYIEFITKLPTSAKITQKIYKIYRKFADVGKNL